MRVRQRSRTALRAFADPLSPVFAETGIDQVKITVKGVFLTACGRRGIAEYRDALATPEPTVDWFNTPTVRPNEIQRRTRRDPSSTIGCALLARTSGERAVAVTVQLRCNPTRTLAHLLHRFRGEGDVAAAIRESAPLEFFASTAHVPLSLNSDTNWLAEVDNAQTAFGEDVFSAFLPIYVDQLRGLTALIVRPFEVTDVSEDGSADVLVSTAGQLRINWGEATAPQAEAYFERHHSGAQAVVRGAAQNVLDRLDHSSVRHHWFETAFSREADLFSMRCTLPNDRALSMYAKAPSRLRFEISRKGAGRYGEPLPPGPSGRLAQILASERRALLDACQWRVVGEMLAEASVPVAADLLDMIAAIAAACAATETDQFPSVLRSLLIDAGISRTASNRRLIAALERRGIIAAVTLRERAAPRRPVRFSLEEPYLAVQRAVLTAISGNDDRAEATS